MSAFKTRYYATIITIYIILFVGVLSMAPWLLPAFKFSVDEFLLSIILLVGLGASLVLVNKHNHFGTFRFQPKTLRTILFYVVFYLVFIVIPEELLFRAIIQSWFSERVGDILAVLFSSTIFGLAHCLNSAKGIHPLQWNWKLIWLSGLAGLFFGAGFAVTGNLTVPIFLHTLLLVLKRVFFVKK